MLLKNLFRKEKYITVHPSVLNELNMPKDSSKPSIPDGMWVKCKKCGQILYKKDLESNFMVCNHCGYHFRLSAQERINLTIDKDTFKEFDKNMETADPINFNGYLDKIDKLKDYTGLKEAVVTGCCKINGNEAIICVMDSNFMMGSMGSVVGEKITRAFEKAIELKLPVIVFTTSGGARMQEGMFSLMQMAKTSAAVAKHSEAGLLYITVLTDPTTGGVTASFAMLGDIILAEPEALVGFAGKRVIEQTIRQELPEGFQKAEFLLEHGFIDRIVSRKQLKNVLALLLAIHE
ncbi:MAG: accD [Clostridiaceae bacterium]|nr:accD [Clostridiaceae bacterium]